MSDYESTQKKRNTIVGVFVIVAVCAFVWLIFKFGDLPIAVSEINSFKVYVQFPRARGVQKNTPVRFCGYQVGRVVSVEPPKILKNEKTEQFYHQALIVLNVEKKYDNIPSNIDVKLMTRGLGSSYIEFCIDPDKPMELFDPNRPETAFLVGGLPPLQGSIGMTSEFFPLESQKKLEEMVNGLGTLISNANEIIGDPNNKGNLRVSLANTANATEQAVQALKEFREFSAAGTKILKNADAKIEEVVTAVISTSEKLSKMMTQMRAILEKVNSGQGTAGKLINDGRLYENLLESSKQLEILLEELRSFMAKAGTKGVPIKLK